MGRRYRVLLVSSSGGVLLDLLALRPWWSSHDVVWVAVRAPDTEIALAGRRVHWRTEPAAATGLRVIPAAWRALRLLRAERPDVIVGMGRWPFDRLIAALAPLCAAHEVFAQTGTSTLQPPCPHRPFLALDELQERLAAADVVITHAGSTVRLVQRLGGVPIAVAREHARGETGDDHQVDYLRAEQRAGRVVALWDVRQLAPAVAAHGAAAARLLAERPLPPPVSDDRLVAVLDDLCGRLVR